MVKQTKTIYLEFVDTLGDIKTISIAMPLLIIFIFQSLRFLLLPFIGLMPQDAYYYLYSQNLDWSYFDHPGMIGYTMRLFTSVLGKSVYTLKLMDFAITSITLYFFYRLSEKFLNSYKALIALLLLSSSFFVSVLSFNSTPDVPLIFFWCASILALSEAIFNGNTINWVFSGILMALAVLSKYTAIFLPIGMFVFLSIDSNYRKYLKTPYPYITLSIVLLGALPIIYWNYHHNFASFNFQTGNRVQKIMELNLRPQWFFGFILVQALLILPLSFYYLNKIIYRFGLKFLKQRMLPNSKTIFLFSFFIPLFLTFLFLSPFYWIKLNWAFPCYLTAIILITNKIPKRFIIGQLAVSMLLHLLLAIEIIFYPISIKSDDTWYGTEKLSRQVYELALKYPNDFVFSADNYKTTSILNFHLDQKIYGANVVGQNGLQYSILDKNLESLRGKSALFIDSENNFQNLNLKSKIPDKLLPHFKKIKELPPIIIRNQFGRPVRKFLIYHCMEYIPPTL